MGTRKGEMKKKKTKRETKKGFWGQAKYVSLLTLWAFCSVIVSQITIEIIMELLLGFEFLTTPIGSGIYSVASYGMALLLIFLVPPKLAEKWHKKDTGAAQTSREELGLNGLPTWVDLGLSPIAFILSTVLAIFLVQFFSIFPWFNSGETQSVGFSPFMNGGEKVIAFFVLVVVAPVFEEIIFRGWLYGKLRAKIDMIPSILIVSVLFGIMHFQWNVGVNVFALSVVLCGLREITGTIYAGILTHMIKNGVAFFLLYVMGFG